MEDKDKKNLIQKIADYFDPSKSKSAEDELRKRLEEGHDKTKLKSFVKGFKGVK